MEINPTAKALHLEYGKLRRLGGSGGCGEEGGEEGRGQRSHATQQSTAAPTFMELITPRSGSAASAVVELEGPRGRMKIEFKGVATAELVALSRALWDGEA